MPPRWRAVIAVFVIGVVVTLASWSAARDQARAHAETRFVARVDEVHAAIVSRLVAYSQVLRGAQAYIGAIGHPDRDQWTRLHSTLQMAESYPGIVGIVYIRRFDQAARELTLREVRRFEPEFALRPSGERPAYAAVTSVEPRSLSNLPVIGSDSWAHPERRRVLEDACDSGENRITGKLSLVIDDPKKPQPGFLMYQAVYARGVRPQSVDERRAALLGYAAIGFRIDALMNGILGEVPRDIAMRVYDGADASAPHLFHASHAAVDMERASSRRVRNFNVGGREWTVHYAALPGADGGQAQLPGILLGGGLLVTLLLTAIVWSQASIRGRAEALAASMTRSLRESETKLRELFAQAPLGVWMVDRQGCIVDCNDKSAELMGATREAVLGFNLLQDARDRVLVEPIRRALAGEPVRIETEYHTTTGNRTSFYEFHFQPVKIDGELAFVLAFAEDISVRKLAESRIEHLAHHDMLTGLANRVLLKDRLDLAIANARRGGSPMALLFLDLDHFKNVNDGLGHTIGDVLLVEVALRLKECVRESDTLARIGGDEFVILLKAGAADSGRISDKLLAAVSRTMHIEGHALNITASIGIAVWPDDGADPETLTRSADAALYHAKNNGRNNYQFYTADMNARAFEALAMDAALRNALRRDELCLHFQPQIDFASRRLIGAEVLVRWQHPELGLVLPGRFIPIAEDRGLIDQIGDWVLHAACRQARAWLDAELAMVPLAVNISALQFKRGALRDSVVNALASAGLAPRYLTLEITETAVMDGVDSAIAILTELREMGVSVEIDDFGTGYSSLAYLKRLPINRLKIDQSFVRDAPGDADDVAIIGAILSMAASLKLDVIAEGVETAEQAAFLAAGGCRAMQGYHFGRPAPAAEFASLLAAGGIAAAEGG